MNKGQNTRGYARYIACDIHREYILVGGQNEDQAWVLTPRRVSLEKFPEWAKRNICAGDIVVLETTTNVWVTYDVLEPLASRVLVANAAAVGEIAGARVKTDKEDIKRLLKLLIGGIVPEVWVPPMPVRELRAFVSYRQRLVKMSTMIRNHLQSLLHKHNLLLSEDGLLDLNWWQAQERISPLEKMQIRQELGLLQEVEKLKREVDEEFERQSTGPIWGKQALQLMQLPGVGFIVAMTVLSAIGDISRFENAKQLVGYAGIGAGVHDSGKTHKEKKITKKGRRELRWAMVEVAQRAVKSDPRWTRKFQEMHKRMHRNQAIVAVARQLLELVWYVLTRRQPYRHFSQERIAYKYLTWAWQMDEAARDGLTRQQFARYYMMRLGIGHDLARIALDPKHPRRLASEEELLALRPDLNHIE